MTRILKVTRLHLNKLSSFAIVPVFILAFVFVLSVVIQFAVMRATGVPASAPEYIEGARWNQAAVWSLPGFLVYYGVQAVATTYPFALALGTTRRNFVLGTMLANVLQALYMAVLMMALLGIELASGHWFMGLYVFDVYLLGAGNLAVLGLSAFLGVWFFLTAGGLFGAMWVRFGNRGPAILGIVLGLALAIALLVLAPRLGDIVSGLSRGALSIVALAVIAVSLAGTWLAMRRASVR
ncbi:hypothetical protein [Leucobacter massiliensis]|uniref:Uncharacterized protein n=1 Tax=Leucobacter massiliensis TaxID=1686285 RepID=A0A2S9QS72_9MICO|nr:hypothetical protein [Leucobacter massiliensis]PRI12441.1 hypothetical protein B4915_01880 [Leucobacter massiliensis]